ncbi:MAG: hypothetical protein HQL31_00005, partial [Planctomycetes bacterium]|nr:hypothetical protein [Planctomycetota bacterium]
ADSPIPLPLVEAKDIQAAPPTLYEKWLCEIAAFVVQWERNKDVAKRLRLIRLAPLLTGSSRKDPICQLHLTVKDLMHGNEFPLEWGVNSDDIYGLVGQSDSEKWRQLERLVRQVKTPMPAMDLRWDGGNSK